MNDERLSITKKNDQTVAVSDEITPDRLEVGSIRLITEQRVRDEELGWLRPIRDGDNLSYEPTDTPDDCYGGECKIVDAEGIVYDGILQDNGTVDEGWFVFDSPTTFERFSRYKDAPGERWST
jgi:hypothetical protein